MKYLQLMRRGSARALIAAGILTSALTQPAHAVGPQAEPPKQTGEQAKPSSSRSHEDYERWLTSSVDRSYKLKYTQTVQDQNELLTAMRNMLDPQTKIFMVPGDGIIVTHAPEDVQVTIAKLLAVLDVPHPRYRITYTLTELDGTRKIGVQHFTINATAGQRTTLKQGSRLPVQVSGSQFTYLDVGVDFETVVTPLQGGAVLKSKVEQTSVAPDSVSPANPNPLIRQTLLEGTTTVELNKLQVLGSLDVPASTRHFDVEALVEQTD